MNVRVVLRIVSVLGLALVAALLLRGLFVASTAKPVAPAMTAIGTAVAKMPVGTLIKADDLLWREIPESDVKKGQIKRDTPAAGRLSGAVVRRAIDEGAAISETDVVYPDSPGFLAAALQPGMRAVSVAIDDVTGNAGLTLPGDRVDLILTHRLDGGGDSRNGPPRVASETVLSDVRVIAVGRTIRAPEIEASGGTAASAGNARTVTLEVGPRDAESVAVVSRLGHLSLALRSLAQTRDSDVDGEETSEPVWGKDISQVVRMAAEPPPERPSRGGVAAPMRVQVFRGSGDGK